MEDLVRLRDLRLRGRHGVSADERAAAQDFSADIECPTDVAHAAAHDDIGDALDYRRLRDIAEQVVGGPPRSLIETLAEEIARRIIEEIGTPWVRVRLTKLRPGTIDGRASVEITRPASRRTPAPQVELHVPEFGPVREFYGRLGFSVEREEGGDDGYLVMRRGGAAIAFWPGSPAVARHSFFGRFPADTRRGVGVEVIVEVEDVAAVHEDARHFARIVSPLERRPWGARDFRIEDPFGYYLRITEPIA